MNRNQTIKYIKTHFNNIGINKIKKFEQSVIKIYNLEKTYELKNPILHKHFIINAVEEFNNKLTLEQLTFRVDFDKDTYKYFIRLDHYYFKKQGCISNHEKLRLNQLYNEKCELNQVIKENTNDKKFKMIRTVIHKYVNYPAYKITMR